MSAPARVYEKLVTAKLLVTQRVPADRVSSQPSSKRWRSVALKLRAGRASCVLTIPY
jgi:hypothetical protein